MDQPTTDMQASKDLWYRNHLVWLVIAIPTLTVLGCMLTIYLAVANPDPLVGDAPVQQSAVPGAAQPD